MEFQTKLKRLATPLVVAFSSLVSVSALAQTPISIPLYPSEPSHPLYYKESANGLRLLQRWVPDYSSLCHDRGQATDVVSRLTDPLKCIPLGIASNSYVSINGLERLRSENTSHGNLHTAASTTATGVPSATAFANDANQREAWMTHSEVGADLHITDYFRAYGQLDNATQSGRRIVGPGPSAANRNNLSLVALFAEGRVDIDQTKYGLRFGREKARSELENQLIPHVKRILGPDHFQC